MSGRLDPELVRILVCPKCKGELNVRLGDDGAEAFLDCQACALGYPVVFDAGHQVRRYGIPSADPQGGTPELIPLLLRAGIAAGANMVFLETHPNPPEAQCDAASQYPLDRLEDLMAEARELAELVRAQGHA